MHTYSTFHENISSLEHYKSLGKSRDRIIPLKCNQCGLIYLKSRHYIKSELVKGHTKNFCSRTCSGMSQRARMRLPCKECGKECEKKLCEIEKNDNSFCSSACAAVYNNKIRSLESREKARQSIIKHYEPIKKEIKPPKLPKLPKLQKKRTRDRRKNKIIFPHSRVYFCKCKHSGKIFASRSIRKYSPEYQHLYSRDEKAAFKFTFNIFNYPDLFDLALLSKHGWYSVGGKSKQPINKNGISRDHKVSITEAISNGYDPYYIKHPLNCQLMLHSENNSKKTKSSITYEMLVEMVNAFDNKMIDGGSGGI